MSNSMTPAERKEKLDKILRDNDLFEHGLLKKEILKIIAEEKEQVRSEDQAFMNAINSDWHKHLVEGFDKEDVYKAIQDNIKNYFAVKKEHA